MFKKTVRIRDDDPEAQQKIAVLQRTQNVVSLELDPNEAAWVIEYYPRTAAEERIRRMQEKIERRRPSPTTRPVPPSVEELIRAVRTVVPRPPPPPPEPDLADFAELFEPVPMQRQRRQRRIDEAARIPSEPKRSEEPEVDHEGGEYGRKIDL